MWTVPPHERPTSNASSSAIPYVRSRGRSSREHGARLFVDGRLDAAAGDGARDLARLRDGEHRAGVTGRRALGRHNRGRCDTLSLRGPARQRVEDVPHAVKVRYLTGSLSKRARQPWPQKK